MDERVWPDSICASTSPFYVYRPKDQQPIDHTSKFILLMSWAESMIQVVVLRSWRRNVHLARASMQVSIFGMLSPGEVVARCALLIAGKLSLQIISPSSLFFKFYRTLVICLH